MPGDSDNLIIYGHHMNSGKMFADLEKYKDKGFYEEHPTILFRTIWGNEQYQILSAFTTPVYTIVHMRIFTAEWAYGRGCKKNSAK